MENKGEDVGGDSKDTKGRIDYLATLARKTQQLQEGKNPDCIEADFDPNKNEGNVNVYMQRGEAGLIQEFWFDKDGLLRVHFLRTLSTSEGEDPSKHVVDSVTTWRENDRFVANQTTRIKADKIRLDRWQREWNKNTIRPPKPQPAQSVQAPKPMGEVTYR